jgi:hypothetical protein
MRNSLYKFIVSTSLVLLASIPASGFKELRMVIVTLFLLTPIIFLCRRRRIEVQYRNKLVLPLISLLFLLTYCIVGLSRGSTDLSTMVQAFTVYGSFFIIYHAAHLAIAAGLLTSISAARSILLGTVIFNILKNLLLLAIALQFFAISAVVESLNVFLGAAVIEYYDPNSLTSRISLANDLLSVLFFCLFILFDAFADQTFRPSPRSKVPVMMLLIVGIIFSFTRFFWILAIAVVILRLVTDRRVLKRSAKYLAATSLAVVTAVATLNDSWFLKIASTRFGDVASVDMKQSQTEALLNGSKSDLLTLFFGHGLGAYLYDFIRSDYQLFMYEDQLASFVYQFGVFGAIFIILYLLVLSYEGQCRFSLQRVSINVVNFFLLVLLLLASSLTNPYLLSSYCALAWLILNAASSTITSRRTSDI